MLRTKPIMRLFERARAAVARRIRRDRGRASEELRPVFDHIEERFYDIDLTLDDMVRKGVVDWRLRERFRGEMGIGIKPCLLQAQGGAGRQLHLLRRHELLFGGPELFELLSSPSGR